MNWMIESLRLVGILALAFTIWVIFGTIAQSIGPVHIGMGP